MYEEIKQCADFIAQRTRAFDPEVGIILGTGLGDFADHIDVKYAIDYKDIPGFPVSTVEGHKGRLIFGMIEGRRAVAMQGRFHYYEGYTMQQAMDEVKMVVEGVYSAKAAIALAKKYGVDMPIIEEVNKVLFEDKPAKEAVNDLMLRDKKMEHGNLGWED